MNEILSEPLAACFEEIVTLCAISWVLSTIKSQDQWTTSSLQLHGAALLEKLIVVQLVKNPPF
jgi:hypothetical protein